MVIIKLCYFILNQIFFLNLDIKHQYVHIRVILELFPNQAINILRRNLSKARIPYGNTGFELRKIMPHLYEILVEQTVVL